MGVCLRKALPNGSESCFASVRCALVEVNYVSLPLSMHHLKRNRVLDVLVHRRNLLDLQVSSMA